MFLPDINFWVALAFQSHAHHAPAKAWMNAAARHSCCMCRITQLGFLRLSTNRTILPHDALPLGDAWRNYDELLSDYRVVFAEEPDALEAAWRSLTHGKSFSPKVWNDDYLAAFAQTAEFELLTFDKGFVRYATVACTILS